MMKIALYTHGGSGNHGCEAIVRSTKKITEADLTLLSDAPEEDLHYGIDKIARVQLSHETALSKSSMKYWKAFVKRRLGDKTAYDKVYFSPIIDAARQCGIAMSVGGDNYCYGVPTHIFLINQELRKAGVKTFLWGCSIEPDALSNIFLQDLRGYDVIAARESITYKALIGHGLKNVKLYPDPAFQLNREDLPLPENFVEGNTVGINVSPLIIGREAASGIVMQNYVNLVSYVLKHTDMHIALIPHVVWKTSNDLDPLTALYNQFHDTGRVASIPDCNAEQLKGYIARCRFMIAARTHASIAAYSQQVPTLVVGYSVKAKGIAADIFGNYEHYVLPVQALNRPHELVDSFQWLLDNESAIRLRMHDFMPDYLSQAMRLAEIF